jgi:Fungalysin metallopeptidase (M36)
VGRRRTRQILALAAAAAFVAGATAAGHPALAVASHRTARTWRFKVPPNTEFVQVRRSLLGTHTWYRQTVRGIPVFGGWYGVQAFNTGRIHVDDLRVNLGSYRPPVATVGKAAAARVASRAIAAKRSLGRQHVLGTQLYVLPAATHARPRLTWLVTSSGGSGAVRSFVDASSGRLVRQLVTSEGKIGHGKVFNPNPVVSLQNEGLRDHADSDAAVPQTAYSMVTLSNLTDGQDKLVGRWVRIVNAKAATSSTGIFVYNRSDNRFEQVNAYYAVDRAQTYIQSLGFRHANASSQKVKTDAFPDDNSFYTSFNDEIDFGSGGVDDAEDQEVVWHEYGHAVQDDQIPGFGQNEQALAMGEGFGDYLAFTMSQGDSPSSPFTPLACIADWDATSYTAGPIHCLRRVDRNKIFPRDMDFEQHDDGEIWSRALFDINHALGRDRANKLILESQFQWTPAETFRQGADVMVKVAKTLYDPTDPTASAQVRAAFDARGILPLP